MAWDIHFVCYAAYASKEIHHLRFFLNKICDLRTICYTTYIQKKSAYDLHPPKKCMRRTIPRCEVLGNPKRQGLYSQSAHLWATAVFLPHSEVLGTPNGRGYGVNPPICGPFLILSPHSEVLGTT